MLNELRKFLIHVQQRAVGLSMFCAWVINGLLIAALLYVVLPQYNQTIDNKEIMRRVELITHRMNVDVINVWQINLVQNQRTYIGSHLLVDADKPIVDAYVARVRNQSFTRTLAPDVALSLMNGNTLCQNVYGVKTPNPDTQWFREAIGAQQICWVPIQSRQGNLIGYAAFIWKQRISQEEIASFISHSIGMVNQ